MHVERCQRRNLILLLPLVRRQNHLARARGVSRLLARRAFGRHVPLVLLAGVTYLLAY